MMNNMTGNGCGIPLNNNIPNIPCTMPSQMNAFQGVQGVQFNSSNVNMSGMNQMNGLGGNINGLGPSVNGGNVNGLPSMINTVPLQFSPNLSGMGNMTYNFGSTSSGINGN